MRLDIMDIVTIVLNGDLEPGFQKDDRREESFKGQVLDCLDIIRAAIETSDPEILRDGAYAPLYARLIVRLIGLCGAWDSEDVRNRACGVLSSMAYCQLKQFRPWPRSPLIPAFLQTCAAGILKSLEGLGISDLPRFKVSAVSVHLHEDVSHPDFPSCNFEQTVSLGTLAHAIGLVLRFLDIFVPSLEANLNARGNDTFIRQNRAWAYHGYQRVWKMLFHWLKNSADMNLKQTLAQVSLGFLTSLRAHCTQEMSLPAVKLDFTYLWCQSLAELLALGTLSDMPALGIGLGDLLNDLSGEYPQHSEAVACVEDVLVPGLVDLARSSTFQTLEASLQVISFPVFNHNNACR